MKLSLFYILAIFALACANAPIVDAAVIKKRSPRGIILTKRAPQGNAPGGNNGAPAPAGNNGAPAPAGNNGAPAPAGNNGAPAPAGNNGAPAPAGNNGAPAPAGNNGVPAPAKNNGAPAPAGNNGAPAPAGNNGAPAPAGNNGAPAPAGNNGTPTPKTPAPAGNNGAPAPAGNNGAPAPAGNNGAPAPAGNNGAQAPGGNNAANNDAKDPKAKEAAKKDDGKKQNAAKVANDASFCNGQTITNGLQIREGSCSTTVQGQIPTADQMVSTIIVEPQNGAKLPANIAFNILVRTRNMALGKFDDPNKGYYLTPQQVNAAGIIEGHQHVTIQQIVNQQETLDPAVFAFFKGLDQPPDGNDLSTTADPLTAGLYRLCTLTGTFGHQPVIMPVAKRGAQDDCIRFEMV